MILSFFLSLSLIYTLYRTVANSFIINALQLLVLEILRIRIIVGAQCYAMLFSSAINARHKHTYIYTTTINNHQQAAAKRKTKSDQHFIYLLFLSSLTRFIYKYLLISISTIDIYY